MWVGVQVGIMYGDGDRITDSVPVGVEAYCMVGPAGVVRSLRCGVRERTRRARGCVLAVVGYVLCLGGAGRKDRNGQYGGYKLSPPLPMAGF